jgi:hypothetical protein
MAQNATLMAALSKGGGGGKGAGNGVIGHGILAGKYLAEYRDSLK